MIEEALRKRIQPIVKRRRRLHLALRLSIYWLIASLVGIALMGANKLWGWGPPIAIALLCGRRRAGYGRDLLQDSPNAAGL